MTSIPENIISIVAPHRCILCSKEDYTLCNACAAEVFGEGPQLCFLCNKPTVDSRVCVPCRQQTAIEHVWMAASYDGAVRQLIRQYKFGRARAAYRPLAQGMIDTLPYLEDVMVIPVPTATVRIRQRGYDQAALLARQIARTQGWRCATPLRRRHGQRQVGASRVLRMQQAQGAFELVRADNVQGRHVLLVDDVTTSGATLLAAAQLLARAGAVQVDAVVAAKHILE